MARHFLTLYLMIVATLALASFGHDLIWQAYARRTGAAETLPAAAALALADEHLRHTGADDPRAALARLARDSGADLELFEPGEVAGADTLARLARGELASMRGADGRLWILKRRAQDGRVLALRFAPAEPRAPAEWLLSFALYAAIALVIMAWLWPLTRDLQSLERATAQFGRRNWIFKADIGPRSQIRPLAEAVRRMAARIDDLVGSHQDMSNAVAHEIKTPLARMRFEIEMARAAPDPAALARHLEHIESDIAELNRFLTATLEYAILERAEVALNLAPHDFTRLVPAVVEAVTRTAPGRLALRCEVPPTATAVSCDAHLMETVLRNFLYNAIRHARTRILVRFTFEPAGFCALDVEDDGPGVPPAERARIFDSFVQLPQGDKPKSGYGLGLAIVHRIAHWHGGEALVTESTLGGARFSVRWPGATVNSK